MTLHITVNATDDELKYSLIDYLTDFFKRKTYNVTSIELLKQSNVSSILNNPDMSSYVKLLYLAHYRTKTYDIIKNNNDFRLIIWDTSFIDDYINQDNLPLPYIKSINRYSQIYDLYLTYDNEVNLKTNKLNHHTIKSDEHMLEKTINTIFNTLPRCNWCGKIFKPSQAHKTYCTNECAKASLEEQNRENNRNYHRRYKDVMTEREKKALGSKNANLHGKSPNLHKDKPDFFKELETIRKAKKSMGL